MLKWKSLLKFEISQKSLQPQPKNLNRSKTRKKPPPASKRKNLKHQRRQKQLRPRIKNQGKSLNPSKRHLRSRQLAAMIRQKLRRASRRNPM
jgi:hypothetical protein